MTQVSLGAKLERLEINYPDKKQIPKNLIKTPLLKEFRPTHKRMSFLEQFAREERPHRIKHVNFQFGKIRGRRAILYFWNNKPYRLIYSDYKDPFITDLINRYKIRTRFPPNSCPLPIARLLRELGLKWVTKRLFEKYNFIVFDEPQLDSVNPDLLAIIKEDLKKIEKLNSLYGTPPENPPHRFKPGLPFKDNTDLEQDIIKHQSDTGISTMMEAVNDPPEYQERSDLMQDISGNQEESTTEEEDHEQSDKRAPFNPNTARYGVDLKNQCFIEIKAYHKITKIGEIEIMQAYNYAILGNKTLFITTGTLGDLKAFKILNEFTELHKKGNKAYEKRIYKKFIHEIEQKYKEEITKLKMEKGQDQYDTRGIYRSVKEKLKKLYKYTNYWPEQIRYKILNRPEQIEEFIRNESPEIGLAIAEPNAFVQLLEKNELKKELRLFKNIRERYLEEIMLDPTQLYPI